MNMCLFEVAMWVNAEVAISIRRGGRKNFEYSGGGGGGGTGGCGVGGGVTFAGGVSTQLHAM